MEELKQDLDCKEQLIIERLLQDEDVEIGKLKCSGQITYEDLRIPWRKVLIDYIESPIEGSVDHVIGQIRKRFFDQNPTSKQLIIIYKDE